MTAPNARLGFGITVAFGTSGVEVELTDCDWDGLQRAVIDTSHHGTTLGVAGSNQVGGRTKTFGKLVDGGTFKIEGHYAGAGILLIGRAKETITVTLPLQDGEATAESFSFTGGAANVKPFKADLDGKMMLSCDLTVCGIVTRTPAT